MDELYNYSPEDVIILLSGVSIGGMAEGTFISVSKESSSFTTKVSADGIVSRAYSKSPLYTVVLTLHSASPSNDVLTDFWLADESSRRGFFTVLIKDPLGTSIFDASVGWISKTPNMDFGDKITNREWTLTCVEADINFGGNGDPSQGNEFDNVLNRVGFENVLNTPIGKIAVKLGNLL